MAYTHKIPYTIVKVFTAMRSGKQAKGELTLVFDKGINSEDNIAEIDAAPGIHFITTYSPSFAEDLIRTKPSLFTPVDTAKNRELVTRGRGEDQLVAWRTTRLLWGKERTVIVTHNPKRRPSRGILSTRSFSVSSKSSSTYETRSKPRRLTG